MPKMTSPLTTGVLAIGALSAGIVSAQVPLTTVNSSYPSGGRTAALAYNASGQRIFAFNSMARSFNIFKSVSGSWTYAGSRAIAGSGFPSLDEPFMIAYGDTVFLAARGSDSVYAFQFDASADTTPTVSPLWSQMLSGGGMINDLILEPTTPQLIAVDNPGNRIAVFTNPATAAPAVNYYNAGGTLNGPNQACVMDWGSGTAWAFITNLSAATVSYTNLTGGSPFTANGSIAIPGASNLASIAAAPDASDTCEHVCVLWGPPGSPAGLAILNAAAMVYETGVNLTPYNPSITGSAFSLIDFQNNKPALMIVDDYGPPANPVGGRDSRALVLMDRNLGGGNFRPCVVNVDVTHNTSNPGGANPALLGFADLTDPWITDKQDGSLFAFDKTNHRLFSRTGFCDLDIFNSLATPGTRNTGGYATNLGAPVNHVTPNGDETPLAAGSGFGFLGLEATGGLRVIDSSTGSLVTNVSSNGMFSGLQIDPVQDRVLLAQTGPEGAFSLDGMTLARTTFSVSTPYLVGPLLDPSNGMAFYLRYTERTPASPETGIYAVFPDGTVTPFPLTYSQATDVTGFVIDPGAHRLFVAFGQTIVVFNVDPAAGASFGSYVQYDLGPSGLNRMNGGAIEIMAPNPNTGVLYFIEERPEGSTMNEFLHAMNGATGAAAFSSVDLGQVEADQFLHVDPSLNRLYFAAAAWAAPPYSVVQVRSGVDGSLIGASNDLGSGVKMQGFAPMPARDRLYLITEGGALFRMPLSGSSFTLTSLGTFSGSGAKTGFAGSGIVASPRNDRLYFVDETADKIHIIDAATDSEVGTGLVTGLAPGFVAVSEKTGRVFVINEGGNLSVFGPGVATVSVGPVNLMPKTVRKDDQNVPVLPLRIALDATEGAALASARIVGSGSGNEASDISSARFMEDTNGDGFGDSVLGTSQTFSADNGAVTFTGGPSLAAGAAGNYVVTYNLGGTGASGATFQASLASADGKILGASSGIPLTTVGATDPLVGGVLTLTDPRTTFSLSLPGGTTTAAYRMAGVPLNTANSTAAQAIQQITGGTYDKSLVRLLVWEAYTQEYVEYGTSSTAVKPAWPGEANAKPAPAGSQPSFTPSFFDPQAPCGFWIICRNGCSLTWTGTSNGSPSNSSMSETLYPGWNLVTNPYDQPVPMSGMSVLGSSSTTLTSGSNTVTTPGGYFWNGSSYSLETGSALPGQAYWIQNLTTSSASLYFDRPPFSTKGSAVRAVSRASAPPPGAALPPPPPSQAPASGGGSSSGGGGGGGGCFLAGTSTGASALPWIPYALALLAAGIASRRRKN